MFKMLPALLLLTSIASSLSSAQAPSKDELTIRAMLAKSSHGYTVRNIDEVLSIYQNDQLLVFDVVAPLQDCCGVKRGREKTVSFFAGTVGPVVSE